MIFSARVQKHLKHKKSTIPPLHNSARSNNDGEMAHRTVVVLTLFTVGIHSRCLTVSSTVRMLVFNGSAKSFVDSSKKKWVCDVLVVRG